MSESTEETIFISVAAIIFAIAFTTVVAFVYYRKNRASASRGARRDVELAAMPSREQHFR
ncbi:hypothetical protein BDW02DRAFT_568933 [Decorospora gaudefroyi]|uniref:Uncharacterized protein n=1 Tax=Decorospora gaudefroyi TaxID=184978 RepID=A0A6A5KGJ0_9PLEO|nr:hypothetical protein BDW02DRAFT_568933 [Decorospora gaudefroyi]